MKNTKKSLKLMLLLALLLIVVAASLLLSQTGILQGNLSQFPGKISNGLTQCRSIGLKSIPSPLMAGQNATIIVSTEPQDWSGKYKISANGGSLSDSMGQNGSVIETEDHIVGYSGGGEGSVITIQTMGDGNENCIATMNVGKPEQNPCEKVEATIDPPDATADQSLEITLKITPPEWQGVWLIQADSGKLQSATLDQGTQGENTDTLVTNASKIFYSGGKSGEQIRIKALGENNNSCSITLPIGNE